MHMFSLMLVLLIYGSSYTADGESGFTVLSKVLDMSTTAGIDVMSHSIAYDPLRERYVFINQLVTNSANKPDVNEIDADYVAQNSTDPGFIGTDFLTSTVIPDIGFTPYYSFADIANDIMYVIDVYGYLLAIDLETENVINYIEFGTYPNGGSWPILNSVCMDPDDIAIAYTTTANGDIYAVDVSNNTVGGWIMDKIYSGGDAIQDENDANPRIDFIAFDCTVYDGYVYFVENPSATTGNLGIYDIEADKLSYNSYVLTVSGRSITSSNGVLVIAQLNSGQILSTDIPYNATESMIPFQNVATNVASGRSILQITTDYDNGIIVIATVNSTNFKGYLHFLQSDDLIEIMPTNNPTTYSPTSSPTTSAPTTNPTGFTLLNKRFDMTAAAGTSSLSYSVGYDAQRKRYAFINGYASDSDNKPDLHEINANYAANDSITDPGFIGTDFLRSSVIPNTGSAPFYTFGDTANAQMYVIDVYGYLLAIDLDTENVVNYIEFGTYPNGGISPTLNSVCIDPNDVSMAFIIDVNGSIYSVDVSNNTVGGWIINKLYSGGNAIQDENGINPRTDFIGSDCTVYDGYIYLVENAMGSTGNMGIYDIKQGILSYDSYVLNVSARSIASSNGVLVIAQLNSGQILSTDIPGNNAMESMMPFQIVTSGVGSGGYILQITIDYDNGIIIVAEQDSNYDGFLEFIQSDYLIQITTPAPTTNPSGFTLLHKTFDMTAAAGTSSASYTVGYDAQRKRYAFINVYASDSSNKPDLHEINANYAAIDSMTDAGFIGTDFLRTSVIPDTGNHPFYSFGDIANDIMYVVDVYGYLLGIDLETENVINYIEFGSYPNDGNSPILNSVCIDPDDTTMAYTTTINGDIYVVDVSNDTVGGWSMSKIYSGGDVIQDENGANPRTDFIGYDCTVYDGYIYFVERRTTGNLGIYHIKQGTLWYNSYVLSVSGRSIASSNGVLVIAQLNSGQILSTNIPDNNSFESMMPFQVVTTGVASGGYILQITIDYDNGIIVVAEQDSFLDGFLEFIQSDYLIQITSEPTPATSAPTANPTTSNPTTSVMTTSGSTTSNPITQKPTLSVDRSTEKDKDKSIGTGIIVLIVLAIIISIGLIVAMIWYFKYKEDKQPTIVKVATQELDELDGYDTKTVEMERTAIIENNDDD